jgi:hypothetical protein
MPSYGVTLPYLRLAGPHGGDDVDLGAKQVGLEFGSWGPGLFHIGGD